MTGLLLAVLAVSEAPVEPIGPIAPVTPLAPLVTAPSGGGPWQGAAAAGSADLGAALGVGIALGLTALLLPPPRKGDDEPEWRRLARDFAPGTLSGTIAPLTAGGSVYLVGAAIDAPERGLTGAYGAAAGYTAGSLIAWGACVPRLAHSCPRTLVVSLFAGTTVGTLLGWYWPEIGIF